MGETITDARRDLETIRTLMERARYYRHLPPQPPLLAGLLALGGAAWTHHRVAAGASEESVTELGLIWSGIFVVSLGTQIALSYRAAKKAGSAFWSPLAAEIVHTLWPPFLVALSFTAILIRNQTLELIAPLWILCYGIGGVAAGAYARPAVRVLGVGFLLAGLIDLLRPFPSAVAIGATFGVFHLIYGLALFRHVARD